MVGKEKKNKKIKFHQMTTKFVCPSQIHSTPLNGDPSVATRFNCRRLMANKMDLVLATRWEPFSSPPLDGA
jgi:hypothetical protein